MNISWRERWRADAAALACAVLFFALFFARVFAGHRFIITGDAFYYTYPLRTVAWNMILSGEMPLWTPLILSGYPLLSVALLAIGYPLTWGHLFLPGHWAEQVYALAPFLLSPITTYAYARTVGRSPLASLLAGLSFGYGGMMCGILANSGMLTNGLVWAPLVLVFIERARTRPFAHCLFGATVAYAMSVLAGHGQSYVYVGSLALAYGLFTSLTLVTTARRERQSSWRSWTHCRPFMVAAGALLLSAGVAAFQLLETLRAARRSVRSSLTYEVFSEGSFAPREALLSLGAQIYHYIDTGTYVTPLALLLAATAVVSALSGRVRDARVWFWLGVAIIAWLLLLGSHTPLNRLVYLVPVVNKFRVPSRHTFEWTLAVSILAAYGWDAANDYFQRDKRPGRAYSFSALALLVATATVGALWWWAVVQWPERHSTIYTRLPERSYWLWKLAFTSLICVLAWNGLKLSATRLRVVILPVAIGLACFVEAHATATCWWAGFVSLPAARFRVVSDATRFLQQFSSAENRVYTRVGMFSEEFPEKPRLEAPNLTMLWGLQNVAGIEPLILSRYSRALGDVGPDAVTPRAGMPLTDELFTPQSHVLDLLNTTHVVTYAGNLGLYEDILTDYDDVGLSVRELNLSVPPGGTVSLRADHASGDQLVLVTSLSNSVMEPDAAVVGRVRLLGADGRSVERNLRAGVDTAEWAHERPDVRAIIKHNLAPIFDSRAGDDANSFRARRYWTRLLLDTPLRVTRIEITNPSRGATLHIWKASMVDTISHHSAALAADTRSAFWTTVYDHDGVQILENARALPRAWLVAEAEAVDSEEALSRIRGTSVQPFEPGRTALLEVRPNELPQLPRGEVAAESSARVVSYGPTRLQIETTAPTATVLVVSEIFYPGWEAKVDGQPARILLADYLLRGVVLPAGQHRIEMRYVAPAARVGAFISAFTLAVLLSLGFYSWRQGKRHYRHTVRSTQAALP